MNQSAAAAILGGVLFAPSHPVSAAQALPFPSAVIPLAPIKLDEKEKTDAAELKKQVEESNRKLTSIQEQLKQLTELLNGKKDNNGFPLSSDPGLVAQMRELKDKIAQIERDVATLKTQTSLRPSTSGSTVQPPIADPKAGKGTVRIVNEYPVQISIVVNSGISHKVAPGKTLDIEVPAGDFTYQLLESGAAATKSVIKEKETVTLRIK